MKSIVSVIFLGSFFLSACLNPVSDNGDKNQAAQEVPVPGEEVISRSIPSGYYGNAVGKTGEDLKAALHDIINDHTSVSYSTVWTALQETDEDPSNPNNVILLYTRRSHAKSDHGGGVQQWNREHSWPKSHGFPTSSWPAYTDLHHLRPTDVSVNSARGSKDFEEGGTIVSEAPLCKSTADTWEPPDVVKGDIARMMFYMAVRYEGDRSNEPDLELVQNPGATSPGSSNLANIDVLLVWHEEDPVSPEEQTRNDLIYENWQGNRNPFIDNPSFVQAIWGGGGSGGTGGGTGEQTLLFEDNFDTGSFGSAWTTEGLNNGRVRLTTSYAPRDTYHAVLDSSVKGSYSTTRLKLNLDLSAVSDVKVEYYYKESGDENHSSDGLYIYNGSWIKAASFNNGPSSWTKYEIDLSAYQDIQIIEWQQYDNYPMSSDGICIDNVKVFGNNGSSGGGTGTWQARSVNQVSPGYPAGYGNNEDMSITFTEPGAEKVKLVFADFQLEEGYDFVTLYDGDYQEIVVYTGNQGAFTTVEVPGDTVVVEFRSDYSVTDQGWKIDVFEYFK